MWFTPDGERKLTGAERRFAIHGASELLEEIQDLDEDHEFRSGVLNSIPPDDRKYLVMWVLNDLIGDAPSPQIRAWNQAIVWEMYQRMAESIEVGVDYQRVEGAKKLHLYPRRFALDAWDEVYADDDDDDDLKPPGLRSTNVEAWKILVDGLFSNVMIDSDFELYERFADLNPEAVENVKEAAGIDPEFFSEGPPPVTSEERSGFEDAWQKILAEENAWYRHYTKTGKIA